jgi:hypothetical protein
MKAICVLSVCVLLGLWVSCVAHSTEPATPAAAPPPEVGPTDLVASFYKALLQKEEPTLAQETSLFGETPSFRYKLPAGDQGKATDPVFLRFFRKHREWFLPLGKFVTEQYLSSCVRISSPFRFEGNVQSVFVMAWFVHNATVEDGRDRTVVFSFERGKISVPCIRPGGFDGEDVTDKIEMMTGVWRKKWLEALKSDDSVNRVYAAYILALNRNEPKALPVLVDSMASFGVPMTGHSEAASVGFCAFKALQAIDNGALMKEMSAGLTSAEKNALEVVVGKGSGDKKLEERISDYLLAPDSLHVQEKNKVASIIMPWFKRNLARFQWDPDSSRLHLIRPVHP